LTISKRFAEMLGGDIAVKSQLGQGCTFTVTIATGSLAGVEMQTAVDEDAADDGVQADGKAAREPAAANHLDGVRILLAEDTPDNQRLISYHLKSCSAEVEIVADGQAAVDQALEAEHAGRPFDVILMDMQMPKLDGYAATSLLRDRGYTRPIVALTAHAMRGDREKCLAAGMDDYLTKPIEPAELFAAVRRVTGMAEKPRDVPASRGPTSTAAAPGDSVVDVEAIRARVQGSSELLVELIDLFLEQCDRLMSDLRQAVARSDVTGVVEAAHALKGSVSNFSAAPATEAARRLEMLARDGDTAKLESALAELVHEIGRLRPVLMTLKEQNAPMRGNA